MCILKLWISSVCNVFKVHFGYIFRFLVFKSNIYYKFSSIFIYTWHWLLCLFCRRIWLYMTLKRVNSVSLGQNSCRSLIFALLSALKQNMQLLQSSGIDVQFVNILYLSSPECVRQSALLLEILKGTSKKKNFFFCIFIHLTSFFSRSSLGETTSATSQCQSLSKALEEKLTQGNKLYMIIGIKSQQNKNLFKR